MGEKSRAGWWVEVEFTPTGRIRRARKPKPKRKRKNKIK